MQHTDMSQPRPVGMMKDGQMEWLHLHGRPEGKLAADAGVAIARY